MTTTVHDFITHIRAGKPVSFEQTMSMIDEHYQFAPTVFENGLGDHVVVNQAGENNGSCKIIAFARLHNLNQQQTLELFGDYYRINVLNDPEGTSHMNIRAFMKHGWDGITMRENPLQPRSQP